MTKEELLDRIPPCGLVCYTCPGFIHGAIKDHSEALLRLRESFREFLGKWTTDLTEYDKYIERLRTDSEPSCPGCRKIDGKGRGCIKGCFIPACTKEHHIDFCGECSEFPCSKIKNSDIYGKEAKQGFYEGSLLIKEHGADKFFEMKKDTSHYINYTKA